MSDIVSTNYFASKLVPGIPYPLHILDPGKTYITGNTSDQMPNKGSNCAIYAINILRDRFGKQCPQNLLGRKIEKCISWFRKNYTLADAKHKFYLNNLKAVMGDFFIEPREIVNAHIQLFEGCKMITRFAQQKEFNTMQEYLLAFLKKDTICLTKELFQKLNIDYCKLEGLFIKHIYINRLFCFDNNISYNMVDEKIFEALKRENSSNEKYKEFSSPYWWLFSKLLDLSSLNQYNMPFERLSIHDKHIVFDSLVERYNLIECIIDLFSLDLHYILASTFFRNAMYQAYNLKNATWSPDSENSLEELIQTLYQLGPLNVGGHVGKYLYSNPPEEIETLQYQGKTIPIFGWPKTARMTRSADGHAVIVVGARDDQDGDGTVFYLDPNDKSENDTPRKIHTMPYLLFKTAIMCKVHYHFVPDEANFNKSFTPYYAGYRSIEDYGSFCERAPFCKETKVEQTPKLDLKELLFSPSSKEITIPIDIGFGNTLGIRKEPFWDLTIPFEWSTEGWKGPILQNKEFKFVKVHASGQVEWEQGNNRVLQADSEIHMPIFS